MRSENVNVKSGGEVVETIEVEIFDSIGEATEHYGSEAAVLELVNRMHRTDASNKARVKATDSTKANAMARIGRKLDKLTPAELQAELAKLGVNVTVQE